MEIKRIEDGLYLENRRLVTKDSNNLMRIDSIDSLANDVQMNVKDLAVTDGDYVKDSSGNILNDGRIVNTWYEVDTTSRVFTQSYADGRTWSNHTKKAGNRILLSFSVIARNSTSIANWGGGYVEIFYSVDGGTVWTSLGDSGYGLGVMLYAAGGIGSEAQTFFVDVAAVTNATQIRIKFRHKSHDIDSLLINQDWNAADNMFTNLTLQEIGV